MLKKALLLTKVNIQEGSVGSFHQDFLTGSSESFVHEVHAVSYQRTQSLCVSLSEHTQTHTNYMLKIYKTHLQ